MMHVHALQQVVADRLHGLHAQSVDVRRRVITREGRQVNARHSFQVPGCLERMILLGQMLQHKHKFHVVSAVIKLQFAYLPFFLCDFAALNFLGPFQHGLGVHSDL